MATRKHKSKKEAEEDVYILQDGDEDEEDLDATIIEAPVDVDWIEYGAEASDSDDEEQPAPGRCRLTFHADMPEHVAQYLFAHHVKDGKMLVEFKPLNPAKRSRDAVVSN